MVTRYYLLFSKNCNTYNSMNWCIKIHMNFAWLKFSPTPSLLFFVNFLNPTPSFFLPLFPLYFWFPRLPSDGPVWKLRVMMLLDLRVTLFKHYSGPKTFFCLGAEFLYSLLCHYVREVILALKLPLTYPIPQKYWYVTFLFDSWA